MAHCWQTINLDALATVKGDFKWMYMCIRHLHLPALQAIGGHFLVEEDDDNLKHINAPRLESVHGKISIELVSCGCELENTRARVCVDAHVCVAVLCRCPRVRCGPVSIPAVCVLWACVVATCYSPLVYVPGAWRVAKFFSRTTQ